MDPKEQEALLARVAELEERVDRLAAESVFYDRQIPMIGRALGRILFALSKANGRGVNLGRRFPH